MKSWRMYLNQVPSDILTQIDQWIPVILPYIDWIFTRTYPYLKILGEYVKIFIELFVNWLPATSLLAYFIIGTILVAIFAVVNYMHPGPEPEPKKKKEKSINLPEELEP